MTRALLALAAAAALLAGCANDTSPESSPERVAAAAFREGGQPSLTVMTMVNNRTGQGGHTALLVKASQTVIFDPAGSFRDETVVERGDVLYGMSPAWVNAYRSAHARETFHVVSQEIPVTAAQAEQALRLVMTNGTVPAAFCASATTDLLRQVDGFSGIEQTFYPVRFMEQIATLPNVRTTRLYENDNGERVDVTGAVQTVSD